MNTKSERDQKLEIVQEIIESRLGLKLNENTRKRKYINARVLFYALAYHETKYGYQKVGRYMGKTHATVLHALNNTLPHVLKENIYKNLYDELKIFLEDDIDEEDLLLYQRGISNLYSELAKKEKMIKELSLQIVSMKCEKDKINNLFKDLTHEEVEVLLDKMNLHSKVIKTQRSMNERSS